MISVESLRLSALVFVGLALCASCVPNEYGRVAATGTGTLIDPPAPRERALDGLEARCGLPALRDAASQVVRPPYLQSVTESSAVLVWTSRSIEPESVALTRAGTEGVTVLPGARDSTRFVQHASQHSVRFEGLEPATTYCYSVIGESGVVHGPIGFRTAPARGSADPAHVLIFGDSGTGSTDQWALRGQMDTVPIDLIVHAGDIAYPSGTIDQYEETFFGVYAPLLGSFSVFPTFGNHDSDGPYREIFALPENGGSNAVERRYSFDWGPIHFVSIDTETNTWEQAEWLDFDLAQNELPWVIVFAHRPAYSSGFYGTSGIHSITGTWLELYVPILERHRVALVITGHDHHYERTEPIDGVTYVVTGAGGASTRRPSPQSFTAFAEDVVHFVLLRVEGDELRLHAIDATGREFDGHVLRRLSP